VVLNNMRGHIPAHDYTLTVTNRGRDTHYSVRLR
jgi:hypothetical protein